MFASTFFSPKPTTLLHTTLIQTDSLRLFERGAESCGQDFLAHPFWDKYIEFEERFEQTDRIFDILARVIHLPLHQYSRYFERYNNMSKQQPIEKLAAPEIITAFRNEIQHATGNPADPERDLRPRLEAYLWECFLQTQTEVTKRWTYEQGIKRPYYHVTDLDQEELDNWKKYLDAEEQEGDYERVKFLYERCLVTAANYEEFWFRYVRWLAAQNGKGEEARSVYQRASCVYLPIALPAIRLQWAKFEESQGRVQVAIAIHDAIIQRLPSHFETIKSLANLQRRHNGVEAAIKVLTYYIEIGTGRCDDQTRGALTAEWARMLWRCLGSSDRARSVFRMGQKQFLDSEPFWSSFLTFEMEQPHSELEEKKVSESRIKSEPNTRFRSEFDDGDCVPHDEPKDGTAHERIKHVVKQIRTKFNLPREVIKGLSSKYMRYLEERGGQGAMEELLKLDFELNGPTSVQAGTGA